MATSPTLVLCEDRVVHPATAALQSALLAAVQCWSDITLKVLPHLYDLAPEGPAVSYLQSVKGDLIVLGWLYPRAAYWILDAHGIRGRLGHTTFFPDDELTPAIPPLGKDGAASSKRATLPDRTIWCLDLRPHKDPVPLVRELERILRGARDDGLGARPAASSAERGEGRGARDTQLHGSNGDLHVQETVRPRWYPVVDRGRCQNCLECLNFCLFGVFGVGQSGELLIEQPDACRDGCPACARVCPQGAIIFPEHNSSAIAGGPQPIAQDLNVDLLQLLGTVDVAGLAQAERQRALAKQQKAREAQATPQQTHSPVEPSPLKTPPKQPDRLDGLVDELDESDL